MNLSSPPPLASGLADLPMWLNRPEWIAFVRQANAEYYHWDELRHRPLPLGLSPAQAWYALSFYRAANRKPLPLVDLAGRPFSYWLPDRAQQVVHLVDRRGGGVFAMPSDAPGIYDDMHDRILIDSLMEEAIATSQIEGAVTTRKAAKELLRSGRKPKDRSEQMIVNGYRTIRLIRERLDRPLTLDLLNEIQISMTHDTLDNPKDAGRLRQDHDQVQVVDTRDNEVVFVPPPAAQLRERLEHLISFANSADAEPFIHPLVRAAVLHFWLAYEHPYVDGNGRTARALFYWFMLKHGYLLFEFLTISRMIHAAPMRYYRSFLYSERDNNDLTYFLMFQLEVAQRALDDLTNRLREMRDQEARMRAVRQAAKLNVRQRAVLDHALRHPRQIYTFESHQRSHGVAYQTARTDILGLADRGFLTEIPAAGRTREFLPHRDLHKRLALSPKRAP